MARLKARWNLKDRVRSVEEIATAMGVNIWRIASEGLLALENEGFETVSNSQRLDVIEEFAAFLLNMTDRLVYEKIDEQSRREFITALGLHLADTVQDNREDATGPDEYRRAFIDLINSRMSDYSDCAFSERDGPGFSLKRTFADRVRERMGPKDNKWIPDYVMDIEVPKAMTALQRPLHTLLAPESQMRKSPVPEGGVWGDG
jgi:hypothetical protein